MLIYVHCVKYITYQISFLEKYYHNKFSEVFSFEHVAKAAYKLLKKKYFYHSRYDLYTGKFPFKNTHSKLFHIAVFPANFQV